MKEEWIFDLVEEENKEVGMYPEPCYFNFTELNHPKDIWKGLSDKVERLLQEGIYHDLWYDYTTERSLWINKQLLKGEVTSLHLKMLVYLIQNTSYAGWCSRYCNSQTELDWYEELYQTKTEGKTKCFLSVSGEIRKKNHVKVFLAKKGCGFPLTRSCYPEDMEVVIPFGMPFNVYKDNQGYILVFSKSHPGYIQNEFKGFVPMRKEDVEYLEWRKSLEEKKQRKIKEIQESWEKEIPEEDLIF
jgi:hypothetical protein